MLIRNELSIKIITVFFIIIELIFGVLVQITSGTINVAVSYLVVLLSLLYSVLLINKSKFSYLMIFGLLFTVFADLFLVVINPMMRIPAMFCFSITQLMYFLYIYENQNNKLIKKYHLIVRLLLAFFMLIITIIVLKDKVDLLSMISIFYYTNLIVNIIYSFFMNQKNYIFLLGLILFALCDLCVGLSAIGEIYFELEEGTFLYIIANPGFNLAWLFYSPSQMLLGLNCYKIYKKCL